jgi:hypothetical protein
MKRVQLWAYVNTVMNLWVLYKHRNSWPANEDMQMELAC